MVMGRKRKHSESTDVVAPSSDKSPATDCSDRSSSKGTGSDTSAQASNDIVCSSLQQDQGSAGEGVEKVPLQRNAANERERARMRVLSKAFARLKTSLPWVPADTKLSKLDTLRLASCYIAHLSQLLAEDSDDQQTTSPVHGAGGNNNSATISSSTTAASAIAGTNIHPLNLTWPFTFSSRNSAMGAISSSSSSSVETSRTASRTNTNHPTKYPALDKAEASSA